MKVRASGFYGVEIRNAQLEGGRLDISLGVARGATKGASARDNKREAERREAAIHLMLERGEWQILRDLRAGKFTAADVANAVRDGRVEHLRRVDAIPLTLGAMIDRVLEEKRATQEPGTVAHYEKVCRAIEDEWGRDRDIPSITTDEGKSWLYRKRGGKPWAPNTQGGYLMVAGYVWRTAIAMELESAERHNARPRITRSIWDNIAPAGERTKRHAFLEPHEWRDLLVRVEGRPEAAFFALGCLAGLRINEALNLRSDLDVDLDAGLIRVQPREGVHAWRPKNDNSVRNIPIHGALGGILRHHREKYSGERYFIRSSRADRPVSYTHAKRWTADWFGAAGLRYGREGEGLTYHSLRHTFASWLIREGWSATLVALWMGNTSREVERTYSHLSPTDLHKLGDAIEAIAGGEKPESSVASSGGKNANSHKD